MKKAFSYSLKHSIPIFISFVPVGLVYGILMATQGYNWLWAALCSLTVFAGSLQYLMIEFFKPGTAYVTVAVMAMLLNSRHIFYGLPFIEKWRSWGGWRHYLIFALPDETFSLHVSNEIPEGADEKWVFIFSAILVHLYWVSLSAIGGFAGKLFTFNTEGMDFALTALFIVIIIEQLKSAKSMFPAIIAAASSVLCLLLIGPDYFILPSLAVTVTVLLLLRQKLEVKYAD